MTCRTTHYAGCACHEARHAAEIATLRAAYAQDLDGLRAELRRADDERATWRDLRDAAREMLAALEAPAPVWDADESEHDEHAAAVVRERDALRDAVQEYLDARHKALVATLAYLDADPADAAARDAASASEARVAAARTRLTTLAGDTTPRRDLPAEAVVSCPACGVDITADLDDDGAYVTRRHSRREPARVGLGDVVWCDGGLVRP